MILTTNHILLYETEISIDLFQQNFISNEIYWKHNLTKYNLS